MRNGTAPQTETASESYAISKAGSNVFDDYIKQTSAPEVHTEVAILSSLQSRYPVSVLWFSLYGSLSRLSIEALFITSRHQAPLSCLMPLGIQCCEMILTAEFL